MDPYEGKTLPEAAGILLRFMEDARTEFEQDQRSAAVSAVVAVGRFVDHLDRQTRFPGDGTPQLALVLHRLASVLGDLNDGFVHDMLSPVKKGKRGLSKVEAVARSTVAAAQTIAMDAGLGWEQAAKLVAKHLRGHRLLQGSKASDADTVARWRHEITRPLERRTLRTIPAASDPRTYGIAAYNSQVAKAREVIAASGAPPEHILRVMVPNMLALAPTLRGGPGNFEIATAISERDAS